MKILSIETSGSICGVALSSNGSLIAEYNSFTANEHDKLLAEYIKRMLADNSLNVKDLAAVAVSAGPGSFTGVRIGGAIAKSLCYGGSPKLIAVPTLDSIANSAISFNSNNSNICVCIKSHKDLVYYRIYDAYANAQSELYFDTMKSVEETISDQTLLCGNGFAGYRRQAHFIDGVKAFMIDSLARRYFANDMFVDPLDYEPMYVQEFVPKS